jgi:DNA-binding IclR family transcriptional regulator
MAVVSKEGKHGVQSFEIGMRIAKSLLDGRPAMMLKDIADASGLPTPKTHRYLVSMIRSGLVVQDPITSRYDLGPLALQIGLTAMDRLDRIQLGLAAISDLRNEVNEATALASWTENGPTVIRWERPYRPISLSVVTVGSLPLLTTASGRAFAAYLPQERLKRLLEAELHNSAVPRKLRSRAAVSRIFEEVRAEGLAVVSSDHWQSGVVSIGAPVFNAADEVTLVVTVIGIDGMLDVRAKGSIAVALRKAARTLSERLGQK